MPESTEGQDWTVPGAHAVAEQIFRLPLPLPGDGLKAVNVYALMHDDGVTLIDSGWVVLKAKQELRASLSLLGADFGDVKRFLVTHVHRDHYTLAVALRREFGTPIHLGRGEAWAVERAADPSWVPELGHRAFLRRHGAQGLLDRMDREGVVLADHDSDEWEPPDGWISDGQRFELDGHELTAVSTPGHTRGHTVFVDGAKDLLFAGDHVLPQITPAIGFEVDAGSGALVAYMDSLRLVRAMPDRRLLPAHGPVVPSAHGRIDELLAHHDIRLSATLDAVSSGCESALEVASSVPWTSRGRRFDELDVYNQFLAVMETFQHLGLLEARGDVEASQESDDQMRYRRPEASSCAAATG